MATLPESTGETFPAVRQIENGEPQAGGPGGIWNEHARAMIERTNNLRAQIAALMATGYQSGSEMLSALSNLGALGLITRTAAGKAVARSITAGLGISVANGDGVAGNPTVSVIVATSEEATAGELNTKVMTPLRVKQVVSEALASFASAAGFVAGDNNYGGYLRWPTWLGGLLFQWGRVQFSGSHNSGDFTLPITFPLAFPVQAYAFLDGVETPHPMTTRYENLSSIGVNLRVSTSVDQISASTARWFVIGR